jgi:DNA mismatch repair protein MLH1
MAVQEGASHTPRHQRLVDSQAGGSLPDITTPQDSTSRANIALLYTASLANDLLEVKMRDLKPDKLGARLKGWVSNANTNWARRGGWLFFINSEQPATRW